MNSKRKRQLVISALLLLIFSLALIAIASWTNDPEISVIISGVGAGLVSSLIFTFLYSILAESLVLTETTENVIKLFVQKFENVTPIDVYESTNIPSPRFNERFHKLLVDSTAYYYKGDTGASTSHRLEQILREDKRISKDRIVFCLVNPNCDFSILKELASRGSVNKDNENIKDMVLKIRLDIFITLHVLFNLREYEKIDIVLYDAAPNFYVHSLSSGLFLAMHLGESFPETYLYQPNVRISKAFLQECKVSETSSRNCFVFDKNKTDEWFKKEILEKLNFKDVYEAKSNLIKKSQNSWDDLLNIGANDRRARMKFKKMAQPKNRKHNTFL